MLRTAECDRSVSSAISRSDLPPAYSSTTNVSTRAWLGRARVEQVYLRQRLPGRKTVAACDLCGRKLPVEVLVAAHIKKRSLCTREERLDAGNIVMNACKLGCDELYERGFVAVDANGTVVTTARPVASALSEALGRVDGRPCAAHSEGARRYFAAHHKSIFRW